ncbi:MAG: thiamine diphosphokinase [Actinomycetota bacterium]
MRTAFIFCGGGPARLPIDVPDDALVIAADVGLTEANRRGVVVDMLVGDLDSVDPVDLEAFESGGGEVRRHPEDKDATDLDLAITDAIVAGVGRIVVVGGDHGRLDHLLGNAVLLASSRHAAVEVDAIFGESRLHVVRRRRELVGVPGELISLFALGGPVHGARTEGLRWALKGAVLEPGSSLGVSNRFVAERAVIEVADGVVLVIRPGVEDGA